MQHLIRNWCKEAPEGIKRIARTETDGDNVLVRAGQCINGIWYGSTITLLAIVFDVMSPVAADSLLLKELNACAAHQIRKAAKGEPPE